MLCKANLNASVLVPTGTGDGGSGLVPLKVGLLLTVYWHQLPWYILHVRVVLFTMLNCHDNQLTFMLLQGYSMNVIIEPQSLMYS